MGEQQKIGMLKKRQSSEPPDKLDHNKKSFDKIGDSYQILHNKIYGEKNYVILKVKG